MIFLYIRRPRLSRTLGLRAAAVGPSQRCQTDPSLPGYGSSSWRPPTSKAARAATIPGLRRPAFSNNTVAPSSVPIAFLSCPAAKKSSSDKHPQPRRVRAWMLRRCWQRSLSLVDMRSFCRFQSSAARRQGYRVYTMQIGRMHYEALCLNWQVYHPGFEPGTSPAHRNRRVPMHLERLSRSCTRVSTNRLKDHRLRPTP
jgi:hypothetical protein